MRNSTTIKYPGEVYICLIGQGRVTTSLASDHPTGEDEWISARCSNNSGTYTLKRYSIGRTMEEKLTTALLKASNIAKQESNLGNSNDMQALVFIRKPSICFCGAVKVIPFSHSPFKPEALISTNEKGNTVVNKTAAWDNELDPPIQKCC